MIEALMEVVEASANASSTPSFLSSRLLDQSAQATLDQQQLAASFDKLMVQQPDAIRANDALHNNNATVATEFVRGGEDVMRHTFADVQRFMADAPNLAMPDLAARQVEICMEVAMTQFQFNSSTYVAQSAKTGLQTLMKNQ